MRIAVGPRVDDHRRIIADEVAIGTFEGEGRGVGRGDAHDAGRYRYGCAPLRIEFGVEVEGRGGSGHCVRSGSRLEGINATGYEDHNIMAMTLTTPNTILGAFQPKGEAAKLAANLAIVVLGTLLLTIAAKISVPVWPVPVTLQSMAVAGLAAAFGARIGVATVALYILEGFSGLPVFASGGGAAYILGPTGGFILGWIPMAWVIGRAADRGASGSFPRLFGWMVVGDAISFALGFAWLIALSGSAGWIDQSNVIGDAFAKAVQPFIVWDLLKLAFAALTVVGGWQLIKSRKD